MKTEQNTQLAVDHVVRSAPQTVRSNEQEKMVADIAEMGAKIVIAQVAAGDMYFKLCEYVRVNSVSKQLLADSLEPLSFTKPRISEIFRVASSPDDIWREFEARRLGFTKALNLTRGTLKLLLTSGEQKEKATWLESIPEHGTEAGPEGVKKEESAASAGVGSQSVKMKATPQDKMEEAALHLARAAEDAGLNRPRVWKMENGYEVTVRKGRGLKKVVVSANEGRVEVDGDGKPVSRSGRE